MILIGKKMERKIKFRGKCIPASKFAGEWVEGCLVACNDSTALIVQALNDHIMIKYHVVPDTVGQFTGFYDRNGKEIFEGDIIGNRYRTYEVKWSEAQGGFILYEYGVSLENQNYYNLGLLNPKRENLKIEGNVYENPEIQDEKSKEEFY